MGIALGKADRDLHLDVEGLSLFHVVIDDIRQPKSRKLAMHRVEMANAPDVAVRLAMVNHSCTTSASTVILRSMYADLHSPVVGCLGLSFSRNIVVQRLLI